MRLVARVLLGLIAFSVVWNLVAVVVNLITGYPHA